MIFRVLNLNWMNPFFLYIWKSVLTPPRMALDTQSNQSNSFKYPRSYVFNRTIDFTYKFPIWYIWCDETALFKYIPAIFRSRILRQRASAFRIGQFSIFVEKLRKKRYSFNVTDMRRAILFDMQTYSLDLNFDAFNYGC